DLWRAPSPRAARRRRPERGVLLDIRPVEGRRERLPADEGPPGGAGLLDREGLIVDGPFGTEEVAAALVHRRIEAPAQAGGEVEAMPGRLVTDGAHEDGGDGVQARAGAQRATHVELVVVEQAEVEATLGGEPHAVAGSAVGLGHRADEADHAPRARQPMVAR